MARKKTYSRRKAMNARQELGQKWMQRIQESEKREKYWRADAQAAEEMYANRDRALASSNQPETRTRFNILHSNVETIVPAIYNSSPEPDIRSRWISRDETDDTAKDVARLLERVIKVQIDDNELDEAMEMGAQDGFLAGLGVVRLRYSADVEETVLEPEQEGGEAIVVGQQPVNERIEFENVSWRDFRMGPGPSWRDKQWVAFRLIVPKETAEDLTDGEVLDHETQLGNSTVATDNPEREQHKDSIVIWEIWDKVERKVIFLREGDGMIVRQEDDPLGLSGFFPMPRPLIPIHLTGELLPVCPYSIYRDMAEELDLISKRIKLITTGLKVRGVIVGDAANMQDLAEAEDNELVVATDLEGIAQTGGLDNAISWWPVDQAIAVLAQLYQNRDLTKQAIYEITGIADIVRGQTDPRETLGAQDLKSQWGSIRVQKMQRMIQRMVRDIFVICAELIPSHFSYRTMQTMTGLQITPEMAQILNQPILSAYRVDVESDSTIRADLTRKKGEMAEFLNGTASFFAAMAPVVQSAPETGAVAAEIYSAFTRYFKLGKQAEDALEQLVEQARQASAQAGEQQDQPTPEEQAKIAEIQLKMQEMQAKFALEEQKLRLEVQKLGLEVQRAEFQAQEAAVKAGIEQDKVGIKAIEVEAGIIKDQEEIELEREQRRPVGIG